MGTLSSEKTFFAVSFYAKTVLYYLHGEECGNNSGGSAPEGVFFIMRSWTTFLAAPFILALTLCGCSMLPEEKLSPATDITLPELERRMAQATDPDGRYAKSRSFVMRQLVETKRFLDQPLEQMVETKFMRPDFFKITTYDDNKPTASVISNGENSWVVDYNAGKVQMLDLESLRQVKRFTDVTKPGSRLSEVFPDIRIFKCRIGDTDYYKLVCPGEKGQGLNVYVDADSCQITRISVVEDGKVTYDSSLKGYGLYEGVRIPEETTVCSDGVEKTSRIIYYKLNPTIDLSEFRPPTF